MPPLLPAELIHRIIVLSLPSTISFEALPARYTLLLAYSLVNSGWRPWAQLELYRHVMLRGRCVNRFRQSTAGRVDLCGQVQSLRVDADYEFDEWIPLYPLLPHFSFLHDLRLEGASFALEQLKLVPSLRQLHLCRIALDLSAAPSSTPLLLPSISALSIVEVAQNAGDWSAIFNPQTLPALNHLFVAFEEYQLSTFGYATFAEAVSTIAPQLQAFGLRDYQGKLSQQIESNVRQFSRLSDLTVRRHSNSSAMREAPFLRSALLQLPSPLDRVRVTAPSTPEIEDEPCAVSGLDQDLEALIDAFQQGDASASTTSLKQVVVPSVASLCERCVSELEDLDEKIREVAEARGCELKRSMPEHAEFGDWESYLDEW